MELSFEATEVRITPESHRKVKVVVEDPNMDDIFYELKVEDVMEYFDEDDVLEHIGIDKVMRYFDLVEK